jgi:5-formyltetrahydrofolate cyclo-ligase
MPVSARGALAPEGSRHTKAELRRLMRAALRRLKPQVRWRWSEEAQARLAALPEIGGAANLILYRATPLEPDTERVFAAAVAEGRSVFFPRVTGSTLVFCRTTRDTRWIPGPFGLLEPDSGEPFGPRDLDRGPTAIVVPGLAFTERGDRLGRGGGHYDRALGSPPLSGRVFSVALAFDLGIVEDLPTAPHDVPVRAIVTERRTIRCVRP